MKRVIPIVLIVVLTLLPLTVFAGDPDNPPGSPSGGSEMPTLQELYEYLTSGVEWIDPGPGGFQEPSAGPSSTMKTLQEIYDAFKALIDQCAARPADVCSGVTFFSTDSSDPLTWGPKTGTAVCEGVPDPNLLPENIKCGVTIYGVTGGGCVAQTGQTSCWNDSGGSISCAGTGQDGEYQMGCPPVEAPAVGYAFGGYNRTSLNPCVGEEFTDNGDGTVTDDRTGLIWLKNASCFGARLWTTALSDANGLASGQCGLSDGSSPGDWRLPNINELRSLFGQFAPFLPAGHPFTGVRSNYYWSSSTPAGYPVSAWYVGLSYGFVNATNKAYTDYVWPVRGGQ